MIRPLLIAAATAVVGALTAVAILFAIDQFDDDNGASEPVVATRTATPTPTATPSPTPTAEERFVTQFQALGCELTSFTDSYNLWLAGAETRGDRIEILGGVGFWRAVLAGIPPLIEQLPTATLEVRSVATTYVQALDAYLTALAEYWFTADPPAADFATSQLSYAEQQRALLQTEAEEAAGGPFNLDCA